MPYQIVYSSQATAAMGQPELEAILADARAGNEARDVTGALVYVDGVFLQILEGDEGTVKALMDSIAADTRHGSVKVFHAADVAERSFGHWRMACVQSSPGQLSDWAGLPGTASVESLLAGLEGQPGRVAQLARGLLQSLVA